MRSWLEQFTNIFSEAGITRVNLNFAMLTRPQEFLTIHQGTNSLPSLHELVEYLRDTTIFNPKERMISVIESQIALLNNPPDTVAIENLNRLLAAHDDILPHEWKSTDALS